MYARIWHLQLRHGMLNEFKEALDAVIRLVRREEGYFGVIALTSGHPDAPEVRVVALWDSAEAVHQSEQDLFLMQAMTRYMACCEGVPKILEKEVLAADFAAD
jgi:quinol monooxygenase YgiN